MTLLVQKDVFGYIRMGLAGVTSLVSDDCMRNHRAASDGCARMSKRAGTNTSCSIQFGIYLSFLQHYFWDGNSKCAFCRIYTVGHLERSATPGGTMHLILSLETCTEHTIHPHHNLI